MDIPILFEHSRYMIHHTVHVWCNILLLVALHILSEVQEVPHPLLSLLYVNTSSCIHNNIHGHLIPTSYLYKSTRPMCVALNCSQNTCIITCTYLLTEALNFCCRRISTTDDVIESLKILQNIKHV